MLVLGVTSIVGVIGLSSLLAVRLQHRDVQARHDAAQAQQLADTGLQLIHARLSSNDNWRNDHTHNVWSSDESLGGGSQLRYKLLDEGEENDGDLADDENDDARLVVRVAHGDAVRLASFRIAGGGLSLGPELLENGGLETGGVWPFTSSFCDLEVHTDNPPRGSYYLWVKNRGNKSAGPAQDMFGKANDDETFLITGRFKMKDNSEQLSIGFIAPQLLIGEVYSKVKPTIGTSWTAISEQVVLDKPVLLSLYLDFDIATTTSGQEFMMDDVSVRRVLDKTLPVVRGSYRRELDG